MAKPIHAGVRPGSWGIAQAGFRGFRTNHIEPDAPAFDEFRVVSELADFPVLYTPEAAPPPA